MPIARVTDRDGALHEIEAEGDTPLMFSLRESGMPVEGTCGGVASCGTCHVFVGTEWSSRLGARETSELEMLESLTNFDEATSRLSCQINMTPELDGLEVTLAPAEFV